MTALDAVFAYALKEEVRENKQSDTIESFFNEALKNTPLQAIITDFDPKYDNI